MEKSCVLIAVAITWSTFCAGSFTGIRKEENFFAVKRDNACPDDYRACNNNECIQHIYFCDSWVDCIDGEDDLGCESCENDEFMCTDKSCISYEKICNGVNDCGDGSDERGCYGFRPFNCSDGTTINYSDVCNSKFDCSNAEEEIGCPPCNDDEFRCSDRQTCIHTDKICDGNADCPMLSDELGCQLYKAYECSSGLKIPRFEVCDSAVNCPSFDDEFGCGECSVTQFRCPDGSCISEDKICDGVDDCGEFSTDEDHCNSYICKGRYKCQTGIQQCMSYDKVCDSNIDCYGGTEEIGCGCPDNHFKCGSGECLPRMFICDGGQNDCNDKSDESGCELSAKKRKVSTQEMKTINHQTNKETLEIIRKMKNRKLEEKQKEKRVEIIKKIRELDNQIDDDY